MNTLHSSLRRAKLAAIDGALVSAFGFTMLSKVDPGDYRITVKRSPRFGDTVTFTRPKGKRQIVTHSADSVLSLFACAKRGDLNGIRLSNLKH